MTKVVSRGMGILVILLALITVGCGFHQAPPPTAPATGIAPVPHAGEKPKASCLSIRASYTRTCERVTSLKKELFCNQQTQTPDELRLLETWKQELKRKEGELASNQCGEPDCFPPPDCPAAIGK